MTQQPKYMIKKFDVVTAKKYTKDGEEKTQWNNVGSLVKFDANGDKPEGFALELSMFPETKFMVFEKKPKTGQTVAGDDMNF